MSAGRRSCGTRAASVLLVACASAGSVARAGGPPAATTLTHAHRHPTAGFGFLTPEDWTVAGVPGRPGVIEAASGPLRVRFLWKAGEPGFDAEHVQCMLERLTPAMEAEPQMRYEYDFVSGTVGERRFLDSAYEVRYDEPVQGQRDWRQRALTIVGGGETLCVIVVAPRVAWKKTATRAVLDGIVTSLAFPKSAPQTP